MTEPVEVETSARTGGRRFIYPIFRIKPEIGKAYIAVTRRRELSSHNRPSTAEILEDGAPLPGPANSIHDDIRIAGGGRYSFWHNRVYFSTPDGSDPRSNGRHYAIAWQPVPARRITALMEHRWIQVGLTPLKRALKCLPEERRQLAFWGALYWVCFAWILYRDTRRFRARRG